MAEQHDMIKPFEPGQVRLATPGQNAGQEIVHCSTSSDGYDIHCAHEFKGLTSVYNAVVDAKSLGERGFVNMELNAFVITSKSFALAQTMEYLHIPHHARSIFLGKCTYARAGTSVDVIPFEPELQCHMTLELSTTTTLPVKNHVAEDDAPVLCFESNEAGEVGYTDRRGKYLGQRGLTLLKV
ncbi:MAG: dCTP deaminase [Rhizobacter sp.]